MTPIINDTEFGSITVDGQRYDHDIIIGLDGKIRKRKKKLSKAIYGTSHTISEDEIRYTFQDSPEGIIIGSGQYGVATLSDEAGEFLDKKHCRILLMPTPEAIREWNRTEGKWIGLFHITC